MATTDQTVSGVPGRYASALFELATDEKATEEVSRQLNTFQSAIDQSEDLSRLVRSPCDDGTTLVVALNYGSQDEIARFLSFRPEKVDSYELGYKGNLFDGGLYISLTGFYADYTDVQIPGSVACTVGNLPSFCGVVSNAGKARFKGFEAEGTARLGRDLLSSGDRLNLSGSFGYIDAEYRQYITLIAGQPTDVAAFRKVQNTPRLTWSGTLAYETPVGDGKVNLGTTVSYRSKTYQFEIPNPYIDQPGFALWDASAVYTAPGGRWSLGLYGRNLLDKKYKTSGYTFIAANATTGAPTLGANGLPIASLGREGTLTAFYGNPRQVFATATLQF